MKFFPTLLCLNLCLAVSCSKQDTPPDGLILLSTAPVTQIGLTTAHCGGEILQDGGLPVLSRGVVWGTSATPTVDLTTKTVDGSGLGIFTSELTLLTTNTYFVRSYATNEKQTYYGSTVTFSINSEAAILTTLAADDITGTTVQIGGTILESGSPVTERGVCWSTSAHPTAALSTRTSDGSGTGEFSSLVTGLTPWTTYYIRAFAISNAGTFYGNEISVHTIPPRVYGTVSDYDGNAYATIDIGSMIWMAENLKTTHLANGVALSTSLGSGSPAYASYANNPTNSAVYGFLYNEAAKTSPDNVCPTGWHVPSTSEWNQLASLLGGMPVAGGRMKSTTAQWIAPNTGASNASGFTALPGGSYLSTAGIFNDMGTDAYFWSAQPGVVNYASYDREAMRTVSIAAPADGIYIRCVKNP
jgi:uncharacterized protein (TIGR02145 family)